MKSDIHITFSSLVISTFVPPQPSHFIIGIELLYAEYNLEVLFVVFDETI